MTEIFDGEKDSNPDRSITYDEVLNKYSPSIAASGGYAQGVSQVFYEGGIYTLNTDAVLQVARGCMNTVDQSMLPRAGDGSDSADWVSTTQEASMALAFVGDWLDATFTALSTTEKTYFNQTAVGIEVTATAGSWAGAGRRYAAPDGPGKYRIQATYELLNGRAQIGYRLYSKGVVVQYDGTGGLDVFDTYNNTGRDNHLTQLVAGEYTIDTVVDLFNAPVFDEIVFSIRSSNGTGGVDIKFNPSSVKLSKESSIYDRNSEGYSLSNMGVAVDDVDANSSQAINDFLAHLETRQELITNRGVGAYSYLKQGNIRLDDDIIGAHGRVTMDFSNSEVDVNSAVGFNIGVDGQARTNNRTIQGGRWFLNSDNATLVSVKDATLFKLQEMDIKLESAGQVGVKIEGNLSFPGPYYNLIRDVRLAGSANAADNQIGIQMLYTTDAGAIGEFGANRCNIRGMPKLSSVSIGLDCQAAAGASYFGIDFESCYNYAAIFGRNAPTVDGTVTSENITGAQIIDSNHVDDGTFLSGSIEFLTGANAGHTTAASKTDLTSNIFLRRGTPYAIAVGDTYRFTGNRVTGVSLTESTLESSETGVYFSAGATNVKCELVFRTQESTSKWFEREVEDATNTIARTVTQHVFEGAVSAGDSVFLEPVDISSVQGGVILLEAGWLDSITVTSSTRGLGVVGEIEIEAFSSGVKKELGTKLTPTAHSRASAVTKELKSADLIKIGQVLKIKAVASSDLPTNEVLRVVLNVGHL